MRKFLEKVVRTLLAFVATFLISAPVYAQKSKLSPGTRLVIAQRDGRLGQTKGIKHLVSDTRVPLKKGNVSGLQTQGVASAATKTVDSKSQFAEPFEENGVQKVQAWISLTDNNLSAIQSVGGVEITSEFDKKVVANIPLDALEKVAALKNVQKVSVAKRLQEKTYYARKYTRAFDVQTWSPDAQQIGLLKAYTGENVVIGIIDTGIQFDHKIFKDENGNTRIKKAYVYSNNRLNEYTGAAINNLTYDTNDEDHGTHTSSIAGGSDFPFNGYYFDNDLYIESGGELSESYDQGLRVYGGMAPKADLVLCGLAGELTDANISASIKGIAEYARSVGKPYVISISLGSQFGPHDGTGEMADVVSQYTGAGGIIVYSAGNDGDQKVYLASSNVTKSNPLSSIFDFTIDTSILYGGSVSYTRTPNVPLAARFYVVDTSTNEIVWYTNEITEDTEISVNDAGAFGGTLSNYFTAYNNRPSSYGYLCAYFDQEDSGKNLLQTFGYYLIATNEKYKIGVSIFPAGANDQVDIDTWGYSYTYFNGSDATATIDGQNISFVAGNGEVSVDDEATYPNAISAGAYTSGKGYVSSGGYVYSTYDDLFGVVSFSSYQKEGVGPLGTRLPDILSPGNIVTSGFNRANTSTSGANGYDELIYGFDSANPLGAMSGTSMAAPATAGIIALWLQADPTLTPARVKEVFAETAIRDEYIDGDQVGKTGKIDALAGIKYILGDAAQLIADPQALDFAGEPEQEQTQTFLVRAAGLTGDVTLTLNDANNVFTLDKTTLTAAEAEAGAEVSVTFNAAEEGDYTGDVTISAAGVDDVVVSLTAKAFVINYGSADSPYLDVAQYATIAEAGWNTSYVDNLYSFTEDNATESGWLTIPTYGAWAGVYYDHPQQWIESSLGTNNTYGGTTWDASAPFLGSDAYFSANARAIGYNSRNNTAERAVTFYVTNTDEVRLLGVGRSGVSATYPASLTVYEVTVNNDGTLTQGDQVSRQTNTSTNSTPYTLTVANLDLQKVYKVVASTYRGYIYEVAFKTPISGDPVIYGTPASVVFDEIEAQETNDQTINVKGAFLADDVTLTLADDNNVFTLSETSVSNADARSADGKNVTVTFAPQEPGTYTGSVTLSSEGADDVVINLSATATKSYPATIDVDITNYGVGTLFFDFPVDIPNNPDLLGVYYVYSAEGDDARLRPITGSIPANTGAVILGNKGIYTFTKNKDYTGQLSGTNLLSGVVEETSLDDVEALNPGATIFTLGHGPESYIGFYRFVGTTLSPYRAYLPLTLAGGAKAIGLTFDSDDATGINVINENPAANSNNWYTIQGQKLNGRPTKNGIYVNGNKVVVIK